MLTLLLSYPPRQSNVSIVPHLSKNPRHLINWIYPLSQTTKMANWSLLLSGVFAFKATPEGNIHAQGHRNGKLHIFVR